MPEMIQHITDYRLQDGEDMPSEVPNEMIYGTASVDIHSTGVKVILGTQQEFVRMKNDDETGSWPREITSELNAGAMSLMFSAQSCDTDPEVVMLMGPEGMAVYNNSNPGERDGIVVFKRGAKSFEIIEGDVNHYTLAEARLRIGLPNHYGPEYAPEITLEGNKP